MSKSTYPLKLPSSIKKAAAELAASDGVSLNQFIAAAVAEKVGSLRTAREFLRERAGSSKPGDMLKFLRRAPKVPPAADDLR
ncbi:MAG TPA: toxin-antitoxin system HicB family antitoxin [Steroidobacteraceae bacterium]|nr:toxin-antitoxin system HicB family antitoxin [Steroidobacteraceae bacterium]